MNCTFNVGDKVDFNGECYPVVERHAVGNGFILRLQGPSGASFPVDCSAVSACTRTKVHAMGGRISTLPPKPSGLVEIVRAFGDPRLFVDQKPMWETLSLEYRELARPLIYAYDIGVEVRRVRGHKLLVDHLVLTLMECLNLGVPAPRLKYGGCYQWRAKRSAAELSTHTWGIAVDLEPTENPMGEAWKNDGRRLDPRIIDTFEQQGWLWGDRFVGTKDPMHFQWAMGY